MASIHSIPHGVQKRSPRGEAEKTANFPCCGAYQAYVRSASAVRTEA